MGQKIYARRIVAVFGSLFVASILGLVTAGFWRAEGVTAYTVIAGAFTLAFVVLAIREWRLRRVVPEKYRHDGDIAN
jgi:hypothetical protein